MLKDAFKVDSPLNHATFVLMAELWSPRKAGLSGTQNEVVLSVQCPVARIMQLIMPSIRIQRRLERLTPDAVMITPSILVKCRRIRPIKSESSSGFHLNQIDLNKAKSSSRRLTRLNPEKEAANKQGSLKFLVLLTHPIKANHRESIYR